jgi:hypothetical protein
VARNETDHDDGDRDDDEGDTETEARGEAHGRVLREIVERGGDRFGGVVFGRE